MQWIRPVWSRWPIPWKPPSACAQTQVTETDNRENFQQVAPETESGLYLVPQVIE